jgi:hypothetical protein
MMCYSSFFLRCLSITCVIFPVISTAQEYFEVESVIKRVQKHIDTFSLIGKNSTIERILSPSRPFTWIDSEKQLYIMHGLIQLCVKKIIMDNSLEPLAHAWKLFIRSFKNVDPHIFLRECTALVFDLYGNFLLACSDRYPLISAIDNTIKLRKKGEPIRIDVLLDVLDQCRDQVEAILRNYGICINVTWYDKISSHWWISPLVLATILCTVLHRSIIKIYLSNTNYYFCQRIKNIIF